MEVSVESNASGIKRWTYPFPYVTMRNVYPTDIYQSLADATKSMIDSKAQLRDIPGYDASGCAITRESPEALQIFLRPVFRDWLSGMFNVPITPYFAIGVHHHEPKSANGFIHNDYNPVWFPLATDESLLQLPNEGICTYKHGQGTLKDDEKIRVIRGVVLIYYLLNDEWKQGDGGGTGLYTSKRSVISSPARVVQPVNNSFVAYECTPNSYHAFLSNLRLPRTSLIMWTHRPYDEAIRRFGEENLEIWK